MVMGTLAEQRLRGRTGTLNNAEGKLLMGLRCFILAGGGVGLLILLTAGGERAITTLITHSMLFGLSKIMTTACTQQSGVPELVCTMQEQ